MADSIRPTEEQFQAFLEELRVRYPESGPFIDIKWESLDTIPVIDGTNIHPDWEEPVWKTLSWIWQIAQIRIRHLRGDLTIGRTALPEAMQEAAKAQVIPEELETR